MSQYGEEPPAESEQVDQLEPNRALDGDELGDPLERGYSPPEKWSAAEGFGNTVSEQRQGESIEQRLAQEVPDVGEESARPQSLDSDTTAEDEADWVNPEVGDERAGRLAGTSGGEGLGVPDAEADLVATDVGIDGAAAPAEEAAVHVVEDE